GAARVRARGVRQRVPVRDASVGADAAEAEQADRRLCDRRFSLADVGQGRRDERVPFCARAEEADRDPYAGRYCGYIRQRSDRQRRSRANHRPSVRRRRGGRRRLARAAVLFDLDGTIWRAAEWYARAAGKGDAKAVERALAQVADG